MFINGYTGVPLSLDSDENFYKRERKILFRKVSNVDSALFNTLKFFGRAAHESDRIRLGMLEAGALSVVLSAFVSAEFLLGSLVHQSTSSGGMDVSSSDNIDIAPISIDQVNQEASALTILIRKPTFRATWGRQKFEIRRRFCSGLTQILLGTDDADVDPKYLWTLALFKKITIS